MKWCFTHEVVVIFEEAPRCRIGLALPSAEIHDCDIETAIVVRAREEDDNERIDHRNS